MAAAADALWEEQKQQRLSGGWLDPHSFSEFDDGSRLVGQRVFVAGHGEGVVRAFRKQMTGASPHEIDFKVAGVKEVKLRRKGNTETPWLLGPHIYASLATEWGDDAAWVTIEVRILGGNSIMLRAREVETIQSLKLQIEAERQFPAGKQRLFLSSGAVLDEEERTLASYNLTDGTVLQLEVAAQITVQDLFAQKHVLDVGDLSVTTVAKLKSLVQQRTSILPDAQRLLLSGKALEDETHTLQQYGVQYGCTISLTQQDEAECAARRAVRTKERAAQEEAQRVPDPEQELEPEPEPGTSAEAQEAFRKDAQNAWSPDPAEGNTADAIWIDGASLDDTPRHMLIGATILVELPAHMLQELYRYEGEAHDETSPRANPSAKGLVVDFTKRRLHGSVHCVDFTLGGMKKHPLGKKDLVLQCAGHTGTGCKFLLLRSSWSGLLKDNIHAEGREQRLCVVYENQRSQLSLGGTEVLAKLGMGVGRAPCKEDFSPEHLNGHLDRPHWSTVDGKLSSNPEGADPPQPPAGFRWDEGGWSIRRSWEYASGWNDEWTTELTEKSTVRRMRWERMLIREDPVAVVEENQRRVRTGAFDKWLASALIDRVDRPPWWCSPACVAGPAKPHVLPQEGFQWDGKWELAGLREFDEDGWSYAKDFGLTWEAQTDQSQVRQRTWRRKMKPITRLSHGVDVGGTADLLVRVHRADNLPSGSPSSCNTYAVVSLGSSMTLKTDTVNGTASPTWNKLVRFPVPVHVPQLLDEGLDTLHCKVFEERMAADSLLGEVRINLVELLASQNAVLLASQTSENAVHIADSSTTTLSGIGTKNRRKVHLSHSAYQDHVGSESTPAVASGAQLPAMFLDESWYHLHPHTTLATTDSLTHGTLQVGIGITHPGVSASFGCASLQSCEELQKLCEAISSDHSEDARARIQYEFQLHNGSYEIPWVVRPHWFENRARWDCEQERAMLRWAALIKEKEREGSSINDEVAQTSRVTSAMATIGSKYFPARALEPEVLALIRQGMPGEDVWRRNRHIEEEEGLPSRVLQTLRSKMWYMLTGGRDLSQNSAGGCLELSKERVDKLRLSAEKTGGRLMFRPSTEDGTALVRGYVAMSICDDMEAWLGLGEKRGGFKAGEAALAQIEKDIPRTEVTSTPAESAALFRILLTFARRYPNVGYCQGMNNIALAVLRTTGAENEAQAFWTFAGLCDRVCTGYYSESMTGVQVDALVTEQLIRERHGEKSPKVNVIDHMLSLGYPVVMKVTQWLVNLFVNAMPMPMLQALWDWLVVDGTCALICFATTLISHLSEEILKCADFQQCNEVLQSAKVPFSTNAYIECARVGPRLLTDAQMLYERVGVERLQTMRIAAIDEIVGRNKERTRNMMVRKLTGSTAVSKDTVERLHDAFDLARKRSPDLRSTMIAGHQTPWEERVIDYKGFVFMMECEMPELAKNEEMLQSLFNAFDDDRSGFVDEQEFIVGLSTLISDDSDSMDDKLRLCFSTADVGNNGKVGAEELHKLLESCYKLAQTRVAPGEDSTGSTEFEQLSVQVKQEVTELFSSIDGTHVCIRFRE